jgi:hypothetical protein
MSTHQREIYNSENGDKWFLCRDNDGGAFVLHKANVSSGGTATKIELGDFLGRDKARTRAPSPCQADRQSRRQGVTGGWSCEFG